MIGFLRFLGASIEEGQWHEMGYRRFVVTKFRLGLFMQRLPYGSQLRPTLNLGSLLSLS